MLLLATCAAIPEPDHDERPLLDALRAAGADARTLAWDDPADRVPPAALVVLRSTWNYYKAPAAFLEWCDRVARSARLLNPPDVVRWNLHKRYLADLERRAVPIVPTAFFDAGRPADLARLLAERSWADVVVKPAVSASSFLTRRFRPGEAPDAQRFLAEQLASRDMMVQPYMASVDDAGERSIMVIASEITHAIRKSPRFAGGDESVSSAIEPTGEERAFARRAIEAAGFDVLYARVDVMRDPSGALRLSELELIEPSLFLLQSPAALARFVRALLDRL